MSEDFSRIYTFIDKKPNWYKECDYNQNGYAEYNEVFTYLKKRVDWNGEEQNVDDLITAYWNKIADEAGEDLPGDVSAETDPSGVVSDNINALTITTTRGAVNAGDGTTTIVPDDGSLDEESTKNIKLSTTRGTIDFNDANIADITDAAGITTGGGTALAQDVLDNLIDLVTYAAAEGPQRSLFEMYNSVSANFQAQELGNIGTVKNPNVLGQKVNQVLSQPVTNLLNKIGVATNGILGTTIVGAAVAVAVKIGVKTLTKTLPKLGEDIWNNTKDIVSNLASGKIGEAAKNIFIDTPVMAVRNTWRFAKNLAVSTGEVLYDIGKTAVSGAYDTAKTYVTGLYDTGKSIYDGVTGGISKIVSGNVIGGAANIVGGTVKAAYNGVKTGVKVVGKAIKLVGDVANSIFGNPLKSAGKFLESAGKVVWNGVKAAGNAVWNGIKSVGSFVGSLFSGW